LLGTSRTPLKTSTVAAAVIVIWLIGDHLLPRGLPPGIIVSGVVFGSIDALLAAGIVLVYRASRVVNFAQAELGAVAAVLALEFVFQWHWNYVPAVLSGLAIGVASGALVELSVIRRLWKAPRLIVAVATIGLAEILNGMAVLIPIEWSGRTGRVFVTPFRNRIHLHLFPYVLNGDYFFAVMVVAAVFAGLTVFLQRSTYGVAVRAASDNSDRAKLLGVPVARLSTIVWAIAGLLSALTVILRVPIVGFASFDSVSSGGASLLLHTFAAALIGGMTSLPRTAAAAVGLGIVTELGAWTFSNSTYVDALLLIVILLALLSRRERFERFVDTKMSSFRALREVRPIPTELRELAEVRAARFSLRALVALAAAGLPLLLSPSQNQLAALILIYSIVAVSLVVLTGWSGHISLGHFAFVGFGAATTGTLLARHGWDLFLAMPAGALVAALAAVIVGLPALRIRGPFLAITTLAFAVTSSTFFLSARFFPWFVPGNVPGAVERPALWNRLSVKADWQMYYVCLAGLVLTMVAAQGIRRSRTGRALVASRDNPLAVQSLSIDTVRLHVAAFALSGAIAGFAGALYILHQQAFNTDSFSPDVSLRLFSIVVIGGLGSLPGAVLGAVYVRGAEFFLPHGWSILASGTGIVFLLIIAPGGLGELMYRARDGLLRRLAAQRHIVVPSLVADMRVDASGHLEPVPPVEHLPIPTLGPTPGAGERQPAPASEPVPAL